MVRLLRAAGHRIPLALMFAVLVLSCLIAVAPRQVAAAACAQPATNYGSASMSFNITNAGDYRVWSRIMAPDANNNSYLLEVDGTNCYTVGDNAIAANTWTWVDYQGGSTSNKINLNLTAGNHTMKLIGREPGVKVDRTMFISDMGCTPTGTGDNCAVNDTTPPSVQITAPANNATVTAQTNITASASDNDTGGVTKVEFYIDGGLRATDTSAPYAYSWDPSAATTGGHTINVKAYDVANNIGSASIVVNLSRPDTQAPSTPTGVTANPASNRVTLNWTASTDNVGVTGYQILRNGAPLNQVGAVTTYVDMTSAPNTGYTYQVAAKDAAGNTSAASTAVSVTTPAVPDTTAPSMPINLTAAAISTSQINLAWRASTDNVIVTGYDVYRAEGSAGAAAKIASNVTTLSFGDNSLKAGTSYSYYVIAKDAAGNSSTKSATVSANTLANPTNPNPPTPTPEPQKLGALKGELLDKQERKLKDVRVTITINGAKKTVMTDSRGRYYIYDIPAGTYNVRYEKRGYWAQTIRTKILETKVKTQNIVLSRQN